jgi:spore maturation protein CgeB
MNILAFGSSLLSSYWNGAATYYRGMYKYLHALGYTITYAEPDAFNRQAHRDYDAVPYARSVVYQPGEWETVLRELAPAADLLVKHSGIGVDDAALEAALPDHRAPGALACIWDVDAPATLARTEGDPADPFRAHLPRYDAALLYGGGPDVVARFKALGARACVEIYNGLDPDTHHPVPPDPRYAADLAFLGNRLPDRERRVEDLFLRAASLAPEMTFLLGGEGWGGKPMPSNVRWLGHVPTGEHNGVNCSARMVLNINRDSMAQVGFSPPTRVFEVAGSGACLLCDAWPGVETFFVPDEEVLVVRNAEEIVAALRTHSVQSAARIGAGLHRRALGQHTYAQRAEQAHELLQQLWAGKDRA